MCLRKGITVLILATETKFCTMGDCILCLLVTEQDAVCNSTEKESACKIICSGLYSYFS